MTSSNGGTPQAPCPNCGRPVWQSRTHPGAWVDERGAAYCRPGTAHIAPGPVPPPAWQHQPAAASGSRNPNRTTWVIVAVITVVAVLGAVAVAISASRDDSPRPTAAGPASSLAPASTSATPRFTVVPGGPAPCDPARPDLFYCFDPALTSDALRSHILQRLPWWKCYGHRDPTAPPDLDVKGYLGICQGVARADRYLWTQEIKWTNTGYHPEAPLEEVTASASVIVFPGRGEHVEDAEMNQKSDGALQLALASLWPDDHAMGQAIYDVYKPLKAECDRGFDHPYPAMTPTGYKVGCMGTTRVTTTNRSGEEVIIRSASAQLSCPMTEEEALESHQLSNSPPAPTQ